MLPQNVMTLPLDWIQFRGIALLSLPGKLCLGIPERRMCLSGEPQSLFFCPGHKKRVYSHKDIWGYMQIWPASQPLRHGVVGLDHIILGTEFLGAAKGWRMLCLVIPGLCTWFLQKCSYRVLFRNEKEYEHCTNWSMYSMKAKLLIYWLLYAPILTYGQGFAEH